METFCVAWKRPDGWYICGFCQPVEIVRWLRDHADLLPSEKGAIAIQSFEKEGDEDEWRPRMADMQLRAEQILRGAN